MRKHYKFEIEGHVISACLEKKIEMDKIMDLLKCMEMEKVEERLDNLQCFDFFQNIAKKVEWDFSTIGDIRKEIFKRFDYKASKKAINRYKQFKKLLQKNQRGV
jgi:hypothetical protein